MLLIDSSSRFSPHPLFALITILSLAFLVKFLQTNKWVYYYIYCTLIGFVFLTNGYAILVLGKCIFSLLLIPNQIIKRSGWQFTVSLHLIMGLSLAFIIIFIFWPASSTKLAFLKSYI